MLAVVVLAILTAGGAKLCTLALAAQELRMARQMLSEDLYWLQQQSMNQDSRQIYTLYFIYGPPCGYTIKRDEQVIRRQLLPASIRWQGQPAAISFLPSGAPVYGAQTIYLYSPTLQQNQAIILMPVTGRIRLSP